MHHHDDTQDDATLVAHVLAGEREAFTPLLLRYYASVVWLCRQLLGSAVEAQDVAQEAALQAFLGLAHLREPGRFGAWLHAIAANLARMALRHRRVLSLDALGDAAPPARLAGGGAATPEDVHAAREVHDAVVAALHDLSGVNREVAIGFYLEGYSYAELAELLGVPVSAVKGRLFKARRQLKQALDPVAQELWAPACRPQKEGRMLTPLIEVELDTVRQIASGKRIVVLREKGAGRVLPIWIGSPEADAIKVAMEGEQAPRPMTHDLALRLLAPLGVQIRRVVVNKLVESTFYSEITLAQGERVYEVDARPSDALALAARTGAPVYAAQAVLDAAGAPDWTCSDDG